MVHRNKSSQVALSAIKRAIDSPEPAYIGRIPGGLSLQAMYAYINGSLFSEQQSAEIRALAGFYAPESSYHKDLYAYAKLELDAPRKATVCLRNDVDPSTPQVADLLENLVDGFVDTVHVWSSCNTGDWLPFLEGKKVLVVSTFKDTILNQWPKRHLLHTKSGIEFPEFELRVVKSPLTVTGCEPFEHESWHAAFEFLCAEVDAVDFDYDIALLSCGAYAQPLGGYLLNRGKTSWIVGGILQTIFGIRGHRWSRLDSNVRRTYNEHWVAPSPEESPKILDSEHRPPWDTFWEIPDTH